MVIVAENIKTKFFLFAHTAWNRFSRRITSVVSQKYIEKFQTMAAAGVEVKSPYSPPFSKGEFFAAGFLTPL
jgi:hypothetical protein